jgi:CcmD family protein
MNNYVYLFWGYNVFWALIALYVVFLATRLGRVGQRLDRLESSLSADDDD